MLEHYQQHDEISKILEDYAYDESFPPNPNAHVYLYRHLKKTGAPEKKLRRVLKVESIVFLNILFIIYLFVVKA
jgi:TATA box-binding protein-associated factor RNA polymerase I subunit A